MTKEVQMIVVAAVIFVLITGGLAWWGMGLSEEVALKQGEITAIEQKIAAADKEIKKKPGLEKEKEALDKHLARYVTILPPKEVATAQTFLRTVQEKVERSQLELRQIVFVEDRPTSKKEPPKKKGGGGTFEEVKVDLAAQGTYDQFLRFLNSIERHETFIRVNTFNCRVNAPAADKVPAEDEEGNIVWNLEIRLQVSTFTYKNQ